MTELSGHEKMAEQALERNDFAGCAAWVKKLRAANDEAGAARLAGRMGAVVEQRIGKLTDALRREARNPEPRWVRVACRQSTEFYDTAVRPGLAPLGEAAGAEQEARVREEAVRALGTLAKAWKRVGDYTSAEQVYRWALEAAGGGKLEGAVRKKIKQNEPAAQRQAARGFFRPRG